MARASALSMQPPLATAPSSATPFLKRRHREGLPTDAKPKAAGILFLTRDGLGLFLKRSGHGDHEGEWALPGGGLEHGEDAETAAIRESREETGWTPEEDADLEQIGNDVGYTTFVQERGAPFIPTLNEEHTAWAWAPLNSPPEPLHSGVKQLLKEYVFDEAAFKEGEHPRGQPKNAGQFVKGGGGSKTVEKGKGEGGSFKVEPSKQAEKAPAASKQSERLAGETDKQFAKRVVDKREKPEHLPENHEAYFHTEGARTIPLEDLVSSKSEGENAQGAENGAKRMAAAANGELSRRGPITVERRPDGKYDIVDGNGTYSSVKQYGWKGLPAKVLFKPGVVAKGLEAADREKKLWGKESPIKTVDDLFVSAFKNQDSLAKTGGAIGKELGIKFINPGVKLDTERVQEKIAEGKPPGRINDVVRGGFVLKNPDQADEIIKGLAQKYEVADEGWFQTTHGYFDRKVMCRFDNGQVGEIQLLHPELYHAKQKQGGHGLYKKSRSLPRGHPDLDALENAQRELYGSVVKALPPEWKALLGKGGNEGNNLAKVAGDTIPAFSPTSKELAGRHFPRHTQASPKRQRVGSPSQYVSTTSFGSFVRSNGKLASKGSFVADSIRGSFLNVKTMPKGNIAATSSKIEAQYTNGPVSKEPCRACTMFARPNSCNTVKGVISPYGHCKFFEALAKDAANVASRQELRSTIKFPPPKGNGTREIDVAFANSGMGPKEQLHPVKKAVEWERRGGHDKAPEFEESKHPRNKGGEFTSKGGGTSKGSGGVTEGKHQFTKVVEGKRVTASGEPLPAHISALRIPPAWTDVSFDPNPKAALLVAGKDAKGRRQAIYSKEFAQSQAAIKFSRIQELEQKFAELEQQNAEGRKSKDPKTRDAADCLYLIMKMGVRPGSDADTKSNVKAYGATTLEGKHVIDEGGKLYLKFTGKKGVSLNLPVLDKELAADLRKRAKAAGADGKLFSNTSQTALLDYVHGLNGGGFKTKDFRTRLATSLAGKLVAEIKTAPTSMKEYKKQVTGVAKQVAAVLGNTATIALQSYINPAVFAHWKLAA